LHTLIYTALGNKKLKINKIIVRVNEWNPGDSISLYCRIKVLMLQSNKLYKERIYFCSFIFCYT